MNDPVRALEEMRNALEACSYAVRGLDVDGESPAPTVEGFATTYRRLSEVAIRLHREVAERDPMHELVRQALIAGQQGWIAILLDGSLSGASDTTTLRRSTELVVLPSRALVRRPAGRLLPDESTIGRLVRRRRERGRRLPDEAVIARIVRKRRTGIGRRLPDEASIARYVRARREAKL